MGRRGLAAGAIALGVAGLLGTAGPGAKAPPASASLVAGTLGPGAPDALLAALPPALRFAVPAGGHASFRLGLRPASAERGLEVEVALVTLLGVPGTWPLEGALGAELAPGLKTRVAPVPEPGSLALFLFGAAGIAGARALGPRRAAGRGAARLSP